ncbi:uncharacterized protein isoform X3 [Musca autumnalis]|uniref:uncharacterized protein isoform X3 n=1 Tax=Musca autumnalis TaxID=221902 RepID=UPI003CF69347
MYFFGKCRNNPLIPLYLIIWLEIFQSGENSASLILNIDKNSKLGKSIKKPPIIEGTNGDLYDIFREHLNHIEEELTYHKLSSDFGVHDDSQNRYWNVRQQEDLSSKNQFKENSRRNSKYTRRSPNHLSKTKRRPNSAIPNHNSSKSLYPSVLTKALEISLNSNAHDGNNNQGNLLANIAQKMNTSVMDLATTLTKPINSNESSLKESGEMRRIMQNYISRSESSGNIQHHPSNTSSDGSQFSGNFVTDLTATEIRNVLERVLEKLEQLRKSKQPGSEEDHINGSWYSIILGLCFDIQWAANNNNLSIEIHDCIPPKQHTIMDLEWKLLGSTIKELGGPFYLYARKEEEHLAGTFLGFCWICDGSDIIFGSWTFLKPFRDCTDTTLAFDVDRDVWHRNRMKQLSQH